MQGTQESHPVHFDSLAGNWKQMRGELRSWWGQRTENDLDQIGGQQDKLIGKLQERYSYTREPAQQKVERRLQEYHVRLGAASSSETTPPMEPPPHRSARARPRTRPRSPQQRRPRRIRPLQPSESNWVRWRA